MPRDRNHDFNLVDLMSAEEVEICVDRTGKLWVNVNGKCLLRVGSTSHIIIEDKRQ